MLQFKDEFPLQDGLYYLNHAAVSPWPRRASEALQAFGHENSTRGAQYYPAWLETEHALREQLRHLINAASTEEIALSKNTSEALSIIAYGINWAPGDEVIISSEEFPSNRIVWESLAAQGVDLKVADISDGAVHEALIAACTPNTRLISVSTVQYASGKRLDWLALSKHCQQHNILLCLDAIQSLGALPFDQQQVKADFIVADGHKWMMAAEGLALLYVKKERISELKLHQYGWHMVQHRGQYDRKEWSPANDATRFECGSPNMLGVQVLHASLGLLHDVGIENVSSAIRKNTEQIIELAEDISDVRCLSPAAWSERGGIVTLKPEGVDLNQLHRDLMTHQVICALRGGGIRFSPHFYTPSETIDRAMQLFAECVANLR